MTDKTLEKARLARMIDAIMEVARGDYSVQIELSGENDDLDALAMGLNMMTDDVRTSHQELVAAHEASLNIMEDLDRQGKELEAINKRLRHEIAERERAEEALLKHTHDLGERVSELTCLYGMGKLMQRRGISLVEILRGTVELMPSAWQYPEVTCARVVLAGQEFKAENYAEAIWKQTSDIIVHGKPVGTVEVCYLKERPESDEGPFLKEERWLIDAIAERLGRVTERRRAEQALAQEQYLLQAIMDNIPDVIYFKDTDSRFTRINKAHADLFGLGDPEQAEGKTDFDFFTDEHAQQAYADEQEIVRSGQPLVGIEEKETWPDGRETWVSTTKMPLRDDEGQITGTFGISRDITERKRAEEALRESEASYRELAGSISDVFFAMDRHLRYTYWNKASENLTGISAKDALGESLYDLFPDIRGTTADKLYLEALRTQQPQSFVNEYRLAGKDLFFEISAYPSRHGLSVFVKDITDRKRAEEALAAERNLLRTLIDNLPDYIFVKDAESRFITTNAAHFRTFNNVRSLDEVVGKTDFDLFPRELAERYYADERQVISSGEPLVDRQELALDQHGHEQWLLTTKVPLRDATGSVVGLMGIARDITERKRAEEQLQRYAAELERANQELKDFTYIVSHDLRAPLVNVKGFSGELRRTHDMVRDAMEVALPHLEAQQRQAVTRALQEDVPEALEFIDASATRMDQLIGALLKLSRVGRRDLSLTPIDMDALVEETLQTLAHQIEEGQVRVTVTTLPQVVADRTSMEQIVGNLLSNAVNYLDRDRPGEIEISGERGQQETTFRVRDNGRGIAEDDMDKVFAPFRRAGRQDTPGEGMGLAYVRALIRRHGGDIRCESELGVGTTFTFTISDHLEKGGDHE